MRTSILSKKEREGIQNYRMYGTPSDAHAGLRDTISDVYSTLVEDIIAIEMLIEYDIYLNKKMKEKGISVIGFRKLYNRRFHLDLFIPRDEVGVAQGDKVVVMGDFKDGAIYNAKIFKAKKVEP